MKYPDYTGFTGWLRSVHSEGTPDSWARWSGTAFLIVVIAVVVMCLFGHQIGETLKNLIVELSGIIFGGAAVRKGIEVGGDVMNNWRNPSATTSYEPEPAPSFATEPEPVPAVVPQPEPVLQNLDTSEEVMSNPPPEIYVSGRRSPKDFLGRDLSL
jgi:hypothetical protein